jgi:hypothetical protein
MQTILGQQSLLIRARLHRRYVATQSKLVVKSVRPVSVNGNAVIWFELQFVKLRTELFGITELSLGVHGR